MKKIALIFLLLILTTGLVGCPWWHHHGGHGVVMAAAMVAAMVAAITRGKMRELEYSVIDAFPQLPGVCESVLAGNRPW